MNSDKLKEILSKHGMWLRDPSKGERADLRYADLRYADLSYADLSYADLSYADLSYADLRYADLRSLVIWACRGNNTVIKSIHCDTYDIAYTDKIIQIGCENHLIADWWKFDNKRILEMDGKQAMKWWKVWKPIIKKIIKYSPAENNGFVESDNE